MSAQPARIIAGNRKIDTFSSITGSLTTQAVAFAPVFFGATPTSGYGTSLQQGFLPNDGQGTVIDLSFNIVRKQVTPAANVVGDWTRWWDELGNCFEIIADIAGAEFVRGPLGRFLKPPMAQCFGITDLCAVATGNVAVIGGNSANWRPIQPHQWGTRQVLTVRTNQTQTISAIAPAGAFHLACHVTADYVVPFTA